MKWWFSMALGLMACGAPVSDDQATCARVGQQCKLANGPLGVCIKGEDTRLICAPQH